MPGPEAPAAPEAPDAAEANEVCADLHPTMATISFHDVGEVIDLTASGGALYLGLGSLRIGELGAVYRARFDTGTLEEVATGFGGGGIAVQGTRILHPAATMVTKDGRVGTEFGSLVVVDTATRARSVLEGPSFIGPGFRLMSVRSADEIFFQGRSGQEVGVWSWHPERSFERLWDSGGGTLLTDGSRVFDYAVAGDPPKGRMARLDRARSEFDPLFENTRPLELLYAGVDREGFYFFDDEERLFRVLDDHGTEIRTLGPAIVAWLKMVNADAIYAVDVRGETVFRIDKRTGTQTELARFDELGVSGLGSDACYVYAILGGMRDVVRIPKPKM